jgi:hypothetical protein
MISTTHDLHAFFDALLGGSLISEESLVQMRTTVLMGMGCHYGLGLDRFDLPCGGQLWGHARHSWIRSGTEPGKLGQPSGSASTTTPEAASTNGTVR